MRARVARAHFIYPAKSYFFVRLQIFLHGGCNFLPPLELPSHTKDDVVIESITTNNIDVYKFGQEIFTIGIFF